MIPPSSEYKKLRDYRCIRPLENSIFNIFDPEGLKLLTLLRFGFIHLSKHRFRHKFQECLNPLWTCSLESEKVEILLYADPWCDDNQNNSILSAPINYIKKTKRFDCYLFD